MHDVSSYIISALPGTAGCLVRINYAAHMQGTFESKKMETNSWIGVQIQITTKTYSAVSCPKAHHLQVFTITPQ